MFPALPSVCPLPVWLLLTLQSSSASKTLFTHKKKLPLNRAEAFFLTISNKFMSLGMNEGLFRNEPDEKHKKHGMLRHTVFFHYILLSVPTGAIF